MALLQDLNGERTQVATVQTIFSRCYCRVTDDVSMGRDVCRVRVDWWLNQSVKEEGGKVPIFTSYYEAPGVSAPEFQSFVQLAGGDIVKALYLWLKTQPDFISAQDA